MNRTTALLPSALLLCLLAAPAARAADPAAQLATFTATAAGAEALEAAVDKLMASTVGKEFPGRLWLQARLADGADPATHDFFSVYRDAATREAFTQKLYATPAWKEFTEAYASNAKTVATGRNNLWHVTTDRAHRYRARFCIMATGCLSVPNTPDVEGQGEFRGEIYHTGRWPAEGVDLRNNTVGIIGTGSSGVQAIPVIAREAKSLTVLQRTPNYNMPANNAPLPADYRDRIKGRYREVRAAQRHSPVGLSAFSRGLGGLGSYAEPTESLLQTSAAERQQALDDAGFEAIRRYKDIALTPEANELAYDMFREQVRRVVQDPETAEGLMPRGYPYGCKRPVIDIGYYETFNRSNVTLVDLRRGGIRCITPTGVQTEQGHFEFEVLVYATGFDAMTGALLRMDIRGRDGRTLAAHWEHGPKTYLGLQMSGFPNLFTVTGPGSPSVLSNMLVSIEQHVDWIDACIRRVHQQGASQIEATEEAEDAWVRHVFEVADGTMLTAESCHSWYLGANIPGKPRVFMPYVAGVDAYRERCEAIVADGYRGFSIS